MTSNYTIMKVCRDKCTYDCKDYKTPLEVCYNPSTLFPGDEQWGGYDTRDTLIDKNTMRRQFYHTQNGSCGKPAEYFDIPLDIVVGPMGHPRPCGRISILKPS